MTRITEINSSVASIKSEVNNTIRDQSVKIENIILKDRETIGGLLTEKTNLAVTNSNRNIQSILSDVQDKHNSNVYNFHQELKQLVISSNEKTQRDVGIINEHLSKHERNQESFSDDNANLQSVISTANEDSPAHRLSVLRIRVNNDLKGV
jgi:hypothetical protein